MKITDWTQNFALKLFLPCFSVGCETQTANQNRNVAKNICKKSGGKDHSYLFLKSAIKLLSFKPTVSTD